MKFFCFTQNNSGGSFENNVAKGIGYHVFIEADSHEDANSRAIAKGIYFDGVDKNLDCPCCGDRWSRVDPRWDNGTDVPEVYGSPLLKQLRAGLPGIKPDFYSCVHYADGSMQWFDQDHQAVTVAA